MQVTYTTTLDDYVAYNRHAAWKSTVMWVVFLLGWLLLPAIALAVGAALFLIEGLWPVALAIAAFGLLYALIYPPFHRIWYDGVVRSYAKGLGTQGVIGRITLIFSEESFVEVTETTRSEVRWENIKGMDVVGDYTFIFVTGLSAAILPRRGFDDNGAYESAVAFARGKIGHAA